MMLKFIRHIHLVNYPPASDNNCHLGFARKAPSDRMLSNKRITRELVITLLISNCIAGGIWACQ